MSKRISLFLVALLMFIAGVAGGFAGRMVADHNYYNTFPRKIEYVEAYHTIREMQEFAGVEPDGVWGDETDREYRRAQSEWRFAIEMENAKLADREMNQ